MPTLPRIPLAEFRTLASRFAQAYPAIASRLGRTGDDPDIERVCDAVMLSGAILIDRTRDDEEAAIASLGDALCPAVLQPVPAVTVLELTSKAPRMIARGAEALTQTGLRFRTARDVCVGPARVVNSRVSHGGTRFELDVAPANAFEGPLDMFVGGSVDGAARLCSALETAKAVAVAPEWSAPLPLHVTVDYTVPRSAALDGDVAEHPLLAVRDYLQLPSRYLFFRIFGLEAVRERPPAKQVTIRCTFDDVVTPIARGALRTNSVLATNVFNATIDAAMFDAMRNRVGVRIAGFTPTSGQLFAPLEVRAARRGAKGDPIRVPAMARVGIDPVEPEAPFAYGVERDDHGAHFVLVAPMNLEPDAYEYVLSASVLATNGGAASELAPNTISLPGPGLDGVIVNNVVATSWSADAPTGIQRSLRVQAFAQLPDATTFDASLRSKLMALIPLGDSPALVSCHRRVAAVETLTVVPQVFRHGGGTTRGFHVSLALDESAFEGRGDAELFLRLLHEALVRSMPPLAPVHLEANLRIAGKILTFD
jgi:hypothetical protein